MSECVSSVKRLLFHSLLAPLVVFCCLAIGCTGEKVSPLNNGASEFSVQKALGTSGAHEACTSEELLSFERAELGETISLDHDSLPRGLFLAKDSELLIERKADSSYSRVLVRETVGSKRGAEIICAENVEGFGTDFDFSMTGLVKFETSERTTGSGFVLRQFFFFQDLMGFGVIVSNPKISSPIFDLRNLIRGGVAPGKLMRTGDRSYILRYVRERENGVRARLVIHLEHI